MRRIIKENINVEVPDFNVVLKKGTPVIVESVKMDMEFNSGSSSLCTLHSETGTALITVRIDSSFLRMPEGEEINPNTNLEH